MSIRMFQSHAAHLKRHFISQCEERQTVQTVGIDAALSVASKLASAKSYNGIFLRGFENEKLGQECQRSTED